MSRRDQLIGAKLIHPVSLVKRRDGKLEWAYKAQDKPRPLYGLQQLARFPHASVLVVEGEKTTDAARKLFPEKVVVSWPGGANSTGSADWKPLIGRNTILWPDNDDSGKKAMGEIQDILMCIGVKSCRIVNLPPDLPKKWDLADPVPDDQNIFEILERTNAQSTPPDRTLSKFMISPLTW